MRLPVPSFSTRPFAYLVSYVLVVLTVCLWPFNFFQSNQVIWNSGGGLRFTPPATAFTRIPPAKLAGLRTWTILIDADILPPWRSGRILSYSLDERRFNFQLDQKGDGIAFRVRTAENQKWGDLLAEKLWAQAEEHRVLLAIIYNGQELSIYVDGERKASQNIGAIDYSAWDDTLPLVLGSSADGKNGWLGVLHQLTILNGAVHFEMLQEAPLLFADSSALISYSFNGGSKPTVVDQGFGSPAQIQWPERFVPYRQTVLQSFRDYWPNPERPFFRDIVANIFIFVPIGYLIALRKEPRRVPLFILAVPILAGMTFSISIEVLQAYLPTRNSSIVDVFTNTLGTGIGVYAQTKMWAERMLQKLNISFRQI